MKKNLFILTLVLISVFSFSACSDDDSSTPEQYVEFTFDGTTYRGTGILSVEAYFSGDITFVGCQKSGYYFWFEIPGNTTGTFIKNSYTAAMTVEAPEGNYDAYHEDDLGTSFTITITQYDDYVKGTFSGTLEGGSTGEVVKNISGSFFVKLSDY